MVHRSTVAIAAVIVAGCATAAELERTGLGGDAGGGGLSASTGGSGNAGAGGSGSSTGGSGSSTGGSGSSTGGATATGGSGNSCTTDGDGDGITDCTEDGDGDPWTDSAIFNGVVGRLDSGGCGGSSCSVIDTTAEADACMTSVAETQSLSAGWDHGSDGCDASGCSEYGYSPGWSTNSDDFAVAADGYVNLTSSGTHCFQMYGQADGDGCAALFVNGATTGLTSSTDTSSLACYDLAAGVYPIRWIENSVGGSSNQQRVRYCFAGTASTCTPTAAIPASMLRVSP